MLAQRTSIFFFFATFKEYLIIFSGLTPASAILPENIDIIDLVFLSKEFTVSLICLLVNKAVIFKFIPSSDKVFIILVV